MKIYFQTFLVLMLFLFGCQKEDLVDCTIETGPKLKRIISCYSIDCAPPVSAIYVEYEYDDHDRISRVTAPSPHGGFPILETIKFGLYEYNSKGQLVKITRSDGGYDLYEYNSRGQFIKMENFVWSNRDSEIHHFRTYYYTYSDDCKIEKEYIEYPLTDMFIYNLYQYSYTGKLSREEHYEDSDNLKSYIIYEYDDSGKLIKESSYLGDNFFISYTLHTYENELNIRSDVFINDGLIHLREIIREYDENKNLIIFESNELSGFSPEFSYRLKYEYFEK